MVDYKKFIESVPEGYLNYNLYGNDYKLNMLTWGWSTTSSCSHIFGVSTNIDSFEQDEYTDTQYSNFNLVVGANIGKHKAAFRVRRITGENTYYYYNDETNVYDEGKWGNLINKTILRAYDVFPVGHIGVGKLYVVAFLETDISKNPYTRYKKKIKAKYGENSYEVEILPFLHYDLSRGGFLRIGTSASFAYGKFKYTDIWDSEEVTLPGWVYYGWEEEWERPSYGNFLRFINFSEMNMEVRISTNTLIISHVWTHLTFLKSKKIYGDTDYQEGEGYFFVKEAERKNFLREFWMGGMFGIRYEGPFEISLILNFPIQYDNALTTDVEGVDGRVFSGLSNPMPKIRRPVYLSIIIGF